MNVSLIKHVPGEHNAGLDGGARYREFFGESHYSFDHRGVHFVALDNVYAPSRKSAPSNSRGSRRILRAVQNPRRL
jgi:hypothetical protein